MGGEGRCHDLRLTVRRDTRQPEKNNPSRHSPLAKDKLTKILVRSEQYRPFLIGQVRTTSSEIPVPISATYRT